ncbi:toxin VasX [Winslowiella sp. 2C04]|uniref:toxin VasX n=1 Tax=Winslowiella sp. 2C04 TaxID=3416179 RepID=UPI003CEC3EA1
MSNAKGCQFCRRYGLSVLPVRPAVMEKGDRLPTPPGSITVAAEGEADYTARLMRQGYRISWRNAHSAG